ESPSAPSNPSPIPAAPGPADQGPPRQEDTVMTLAASYGAVVTGASTSLVGVLPSIGSAVLSASATSSAGSRLILAQNVAPLPTTQSGGGGGSSATEAHPGPGLERTTSQTLVKESTSLRRVPWRPSPIISKQDTLAEGIFSGSDDDPDDAERAEQDRLFLALGIGTLSPENDFFGALHIEPVKQDEQFGSL